MRNRSLQRKFSVTHQSQYQLGFIFVTFLIKIFFTLKNRHFEGLFWNIAYISTITGNFPEKICRQDNFDEFYSFLIPDSRNNLEIYPKKLHNLDVLILRPYIFGKTRGFSSKIVMIFGIRILQSPRNVYSGLCILQKNKNWYLSRWVLS
jgi:hypothetical protein